MDQPYHMLSYIHESPEALRLTLQANEEKVKKIAADALTRKVDKVVVAGLGSSYTAAVMAAPLFYLHCPFPCLVLNAEDTKYYADRWIDERSLVVVISRSGERGAVVDTLKLANTNGALGVAVTGVADSLLAQNSRLTLVTQEGPEITFPKTKSVTTCAGMLMRLGLTLADTIDQMAVQRNQMLTNAPDILQKNIHAIEPRIKFLIPFITSHKNLNVVGSCSNYGVALEAAVKVQEASFITTRGDSIAGLLQGPIGALNSDWLVVALTMAEDEAQIQELLKLLRDFGAHAMVVHPTGMDFSSYCDKSIILVEGQDPFLAALQYLPVVQFMAYYWTVSRGMNPDEPSSMRKILGSILPPGRQEPELKK